MSQWTVGQEQEELSRVWEGWPGAPVSALMLGEVTQRASAGWSSHGAWGRGLSQEDVIPRSGRVPTGAQKPLQAVEGARDLRQRELSCGEG